MVFQLFVLYYKRLDDQTSCFFFQVFFFHFIILHTLEIEHIIINYYCNVKAIIIDEKLLSKKEKKVHFQCTKRNHLPHGMEYVITSYKI